MPAVDIARSADFYRAVFGWKIRTRGDGSTAFDDGVGEVSGAWVRGRPPQGAPGLLVYIMVKDAAATLELIVANGGQVGSGHRRRCAGDHGAVQGSRRQRHRPLPGADVSDAVHHALRSRTLILLNVATETQRHRELNASHPRFGGSAHDERRDTSRADRTLAFPPLIATHVSPAMPADVRRVGICSVRSGSL